MKPTGSSSLKASSTGLKRTDRVCRFTKTERFFHWSFVLPQIILMMTGGWLLVFGGRLSESTTKINVVVAHKAAAICFILAPFMVFIAGDTRAIARNIRLALAWNRSDLSWFYRSFAKVFAPSVVLPDAGKFNPGQKVNMLIVAIMAATFAVSGLSMWFSDIALLAWIIHAAAFLFAIFLVLGHVYMAVLHPSTRPSFWAIINGGVDREWAGHHHPEWLRELDGLGTDED